MSTRRAVLAAGLGSAAALAASALGRPDAVRAEGEGIVVGGEYTSAASVTLLTNTANDAAVLMGESTGVGTGVGGRSGSGDGVVGRSGGAAKSGVFGVHSGNGYGVFGRNQLTDAWGALGAGGNGVAGRATGGNIGVEGVATGGGTGVFGLSDTGSGLYGRSPDGYALVADGRASFSASGVVVIGPGKTSRVVDPKVKVTIDSFVLLTPRTNLLGRDLWYTTNPAANRFTIHLSAASPGPTKVAWLMLG